MWVCQREREKNQCGFLRPWQKCSDVTGYRRKEAQSKKIREKMGMSDLLGKSIFLMYYCLSSICQMPKRHAKEQMDSERGGGIYTHTHTRMFVYICI